MTVRLMSGMLYGAHARPGPEGFTVDPDLADPTPVLVGLFGNIAPPHCWAGCAPLLPGPRRAAPVSEALANLGSDIITCTPHNRLWRTRDDVRSPGSQAPR